MAREEFIDNLRLASRLLPPTTVSSDHGPQADAYLRSSTPAADLWLTKKPVEGFASEDFAGWSKAEREQLAKEVATFRALVERVPTDKPAPRSLSKQARGHLERVIEVVRRRLLPEWLGSLAEMLREAEEAARSKGWYVEQDEKEIVESLLGAYRAPRLDVRSRDREVILDPIACFGSGRQGVVDLVVMPTYETAYYITLKGGLWWIVSARGTMHSRPFDRSTFINTVNRLPLAHATY